MPDVARSRKRQVLESKRQSALSRKRPLWSKATGLDRPAFDNRRAQNWEVRVSWGCLLRHVLSISPPILLPAFLQFDRTEFRYNFRAEVLPAPRPVTRDVFGRVTKLTVTQIKRTEEMPVHPELLAKPRWEISTQLTETEVREVERRAAESHKRHSRRVLRHLTGYVNPQQREAIRMRELRQRRSARAAATLTLEELVQEAAFPVQDPLPASGEPDSGRPIATPVRRDRLPSPTRASRSGMSGLEEDELSSDEEDEDAQPPAP